MSGQMGRWMDRWMSERKDGQMHGGGRLTHGWVDGWVDKKM